MGYTMEVSSAKSAEKLFVISVKQKSSVFPNPVEEMVLLSSCPFVNVFVYLRVTT